MADPPTVVLGAGIVGVCTAYYLSAHQAPASVHLVEAADRLFASASGYAGGFLARDWFGPPVAALAALSFDEHRALAAALDGRRRWGYAASRAVSYRMGGLGDDDELGEGADDEHEHGEDWLRQGTSRSTAAKTATKTEDPLPLPAWFCRPDGDDVRGLDADGPTAQVDPLQFCHAILAECLARGVRLHQPARAVAVDTDADGALSHVHLEMDGESSSIRLPCTRLVLAAGAWTPRVLDQLFPGRGAGLPITSLAGHSLLVQRCANDDTQTPLHALFAAGAGLGFCPEVFARADGSLYLAGLNAATLPLPARATDAVAAADAGAALLAGCRRVLGWAEEEDVLVVRAGLCHRPVTPWGRPVVARLAADVGGGNVFVAAGHGPWGISMGPGTGRVVAELVQGRAGSANVGGLGVGDT